MTEKTIDDICQKREYIIVLDDDEKLGGVFCDTKAGANCQAIDFVICENHVISIREGELDD